GHPPVTRSSPAPRADAARGRGIARSAHPGPGPAGPAPAGAPRPPGPPRAAGGLTRPPRFRLPPQGWLVQPAPREEASNVRSGYPGAARHLPHRDDLLRGQQAARPGPLARPVHERVQEGDERPEPGGGEGRGREEADLIPGTAGPGGTPCRAP